MAVMQRQRRQQLQQNPAEEEEEEEEEGLLLQILPKGSKRVASRRATCSLREDAMESVVHTNQKKELLCSPRAALLLLLLTTVTSAEEGAQVKNSQCHNYAGGHVYPGEAFRVPVSDHSLHLSKAKSESVRLPVRAAGDL